MDNEIRFGTEKIIDIKTNNEIYEKERRNYDIKRDERLLLNLKIFLQLFLFFFKKTDIN